MTDSISSDQAVRIKAISNVVIALLSGISFFTYLLIIFMPKIKSDILTRFIIRSQRFR